MSVLLLASPAAASPLFDEANTLKDTGGCARAVDLYDDVVASAADPQLAAWARFNQGVCFEELGQPLAAVASYTSILDGPRVPEGLADARFRRGLMLTELGRSTEARRDFRRLLGAARSPQDRASLALQLAWLDVQAGHNLRAARAASRALAVLDRLAADAVEGELRWLRSQAEVILGDAWRRRASRRHLSPRSSARALTRTLERRADELQQAERRFTAALQRGDPAWGCGALLLLGQGYAELAKEVQALHEGPLPPRLEPLRAWLGERRPHLWRKARESWALCRDLRGRTGTRSAFGDRCLERLEALPVEALRE